MRLGAPWGQESRTCPYSLWCLEQCVMINVICQLDWVTRCPDTWLTINLSESLWVFLDEINLWISRLSKADCPLECGWASSNPLVARTEQKAEQRRIHAVFKMGHQSSPDFGLGLGLEFNTISSPGSQACWLQILGPLSLHNCVNQFLIINIFIYIYMYLYLDIHKILLVLFLWRSQTNTECEGSTKGWGWMREWMNGNWVLGMPPKLCSWACQEMPQRETRGQSDTNLHSVVLNLSRTWRSTWRALKIPLPDTN